MSLAFELFLFIKVMASELPYFKFYPSEWLLGRISDETLRFQGLFLRACCYFWHKNDINYENFCMKVGKKNTELLIKKEYIIKKNDKILIEHILQNIHNIAKNKNKALIIHVSYNSFRPKKQNGVSSGH